MNLSLVAVEKPDDVNVILGQAHFIKTIEDVHEAMVAASPHIRFGAAFCESSGERLIRKSGNDPELVDMAARTAHKLGAGHSFLVLMRGGFPVNVLNALKALPTVCRIYCATANPLQVMIAQGAQGRGVLGVIDGGLPLGIEDDGKIAERKALLRRLGYKL